MKYNNYTEEELMEKLDESVLGVLSDRNLLAYTIKSMVKELKDIPLEEVAEKHILEINPVMIKVTATPKDDPNGKVEKNNVCCVITKVLLPNGDIVGGNVLN